MKTTKHARREATQLSRLCVINGSLNEVRVREVVHQLVTAKPRGYLGILSHFRRLLQLHQARHTAKVESARPLTPELQTTVQAHLTRAYGAGLITSFAQNSALIGGMRIQVVSDVYDGSLKARLAALEQSFCTVA
jgi:F-type H+-transporting ATPase subunit delta